MQRHCTGRDNTLVQWKNGTLVPCDCQKKFNDDDHMVVFPHEPFAKLDLENLDIDFEDISKKGQFDVGST